MAIQFFDLIDQDIAIAQSQQAIEAEISLITCVDIILAVFSVI